ncbi:MAG: CvpA family protein [Oscillospiraceae bacterium]|nr:CvpA family protein [Oscillospiraceae bacterium]
MTFIVDIALLAVFAFIVIWASRRGFLNVLLGIASWIIASMVATAFSGPLAAWFYDSFLETRVIATITENVPYAEDAEAVARSAASVIENIPEALVRAAESIGINTQGLIDSAAGVDAKSLTVSIAQELSDKVARPIMSAGLKVIFFFILLVLLLTALRFVARLIEKVAKLPLLKQANRLLGAALGVVKGVIIVIVASVTLNLLAGLADGEGNFATAVEESKIVSLICGREMWEMIF